jgi:superfamily I DNA/RNA helicase
MVEFQLSKQQQEAVDYSGEHMLIKGIAGSGKTTVLLAKAQTLLSKFPNVTITLFTFNKTLKKYASDLAELLGHNGLMVTTFHGWSYQKLRDKKIRINAVTDREQKECLKHSIEKLGKTITSRFISDSKYRDFLLEEIAWMKGMDIRKEGSYLTAERTGRGSKVRVTEADRKVIFGIMTEYNKRLQALGKKDYSDYALMLMDEWSKESSNACIDYVFIDEAQDLNYLQLLLLRKAARKGLIIAADKGQKIYKTSFSWRQIGINVSGGRTKVLTQSYRSTKQIIMLAHSLQKHDPLVKEKDEEYVSPDYPSIEGPTPQVWTCNGSLEESNLIKRFVQEIQKSHPDYTIGLTARTWSDIYGLKSKLEQASIKPEVIQKDEGDCLTPGIKMTTFHSIKGLEFDAVIIFKLNHGNVPLTENLPVESGSDDEHEAVERRLLYVAMTRAKKMLYLINSASKSNFQDELDASLYELKKV